MKKYKHVTEKTFDQVKRLQAAGVNNIVIISKISGYSYPTACLLAKSKTWEAYQAKNKEYTLNRKMKRMGFNKQVKEVVDETAKKSKGQRIMAIIEELKREIMS